MIRDSTREFAEAEIAPRAAQIDRDNLFPRDLWPKMGALGLHGITAPEEYGGLALGYLEHCVAIEEVSRRLGPRSGFPTAPIPIFASTSSHATAMTIRSSVYLKSDD